ncbi:hypothetical protein SAMN02745134_02834 [Clostridium acidisoli DSM 12555]|uniref:Uncharacterized protein n=1 Tax=Clostridium acidisoli DSM 12555 TaxID=1121291 RepID=A0A1W1XRC7_9CLOT|nr:hypothetical protein [Clostridium acidisoli]SMC26437.1 hypothetical protein SAMN02745134_02834 [Clostridium acidisoli DSM 12555]
MIFLLIIIFIGIIFFEAPSLIKNKHWYELKVFSVFLFIAFVMSVLQVKDIPIPNPAKGMEYLVKDVLHLNYK